MVEVDITVGILGTEIYFEAGTQVDNSKYLMRQFARIPLVNNFVLYEMLDVFGDLIPEIPEFKEQIKEFHQNFDVKSKVTKPIVMKNSI